jgi:glutamine cyclotransferase
LDRDDVVYTQGLVFINGKLLESGGQYGRSSIGFLNIEKQSSKITNDVQRKLDTKYFGEGCDMPAGDYIYQLTWQLRSILVWDKSLANSSPVFDAPFPS